VPPTRALLLYRELLGEHRTRLDRLIDRRGRARMKRMYEQAEADLLKKLAAQAGSRGATFTAHTHRLMLAQIRQGQAMIARRMAGELGDLTKEAQVESLRGLGRQVTKLENAFTGVTTVLPIEEAATFQGIIRGRSTSLMRRHEISMARYGARLVGKMEGELSQSLMQGETMHDAIGRIEEVTGKEWWQAERIVRTECLPGDTLVSGAMVRAAHRRWYEGAMVEIVTQRGRSLSATPNHPMLTRRGWVGAGLLREDDDLICYIRDKNTSSTRNEDVTDGPSSIAEIFNAVAAIGVTKRRRGRNPDFHGDGRDSDVDVACADRMLPVGSFSPLDKPSIQRFFSPPHSVTSSCCDRCGKLLGVAQRGSLRDSAFRYMRVVQSSVDQFVAYAEAFCNAAHGLAASVLFDNLLCLDMPLEPGVSFSQCKCCTLGSCNSSTLDGALYEMFADMHECSDLPGAKPSEIEVDRIVRIEISDFRGHVYNLTTPDGYFAISDAITGNTAMAYSATSADGIAAISDSVGGMWMRWTEFVSDSTGEGLDDRVGIDSEAMHGQVAPPGGKFTQPPTSKSGGIVKGKIVGEEFEFPPNRPNDRSVLAPFRPEWGVPGWQWVGGRRVPVKKIPDAGEFGGGASALAEAAQGGM